MNADKDQISPNYENIDQHPLRYSNLAQTIEQILIARLHYGRIEGYTLETAIHIADAIVGTAPRNR